MHQRLITQILPSLPTGKHASPLPACSRGHHELYQPRADTKQCKRVFLLVV
jgi:hypothetical protein